MSAFTHPVRTPHPAPHVGKYTGVLGAIPIPHTRLSEYC
jgi:hypothetical protein